MFIKAIHFSEQEVGRNIRSTKKKYAWKFLIDNIEEELTLYVSSLSGRKQITLNGRTIHEESNLFGDFRFVYKIEQCQATIVPQQSSFELYLDNVSFQECLQSGNSHAKNNYINKPLTNYDDQEYDLSPLKDIEPPKKQQQSQSIQLKLRVKEPISNLKQQQTDSKQFDQGWWKQKPNEDCNLGTPSTNGTENIFNNFGFSFETPKKPNQQQPSAQTTSQNCTQKTNPFANNNCPQSQQSFYPVQTQTNSQYPFWENNNSQQLSQDNSSAKQVTVGIKNAQSFQPPQTTEKQQQLKTIPIFQEQRQPLPTFQLNQQPKQNQDFSSQHQLQYIQPFQSSQVNEPQKFYTSVTQQIISTNLLDLLDDTPQPQQATIYSTNSISPQLYGNYPATSPQPIQQHLQNRFIYSEQKQSSQGVLPLQYQQSSMEPHYRTTVSLPQTNSQSSKKTLSKELEDMFDEPTINYQIPNQRRPTPFDDDIFI